MGPADPVFTRRAIPPDKSIHLNNVAQNYLPSPASLGSVLLLRDCEQPPASADGGIRRAGWAGVNTTGGVHAAMTEHSCGPGQRGAIVTEVRG